MSTRIQKIKETYSQQFEKQLQQESVSISLESAWDILISSDPSPNKKNVRWLVETYINNGYLWEDIMGGPTSKVAETLVEFDKHKRNLEPAERSLNKYHKLGRLWSSIKPYVGQLTPSEEKREERERAYNEAEVVIDDEKGLKIIVPKTEYAAQWFGKGTRWCTSADNNNMFKYYANESPLFIILMPNGDKLQLWRDDTQPQFMDESDEDVSIEYIEEHWDVLEPVIHFAGLLEFYPEDKMPSNYISLVRKNPQNFKSIPSYQKTEEMCHAVIQKTGGLLYAVPDRFKTYELCQVAVKQNGMAMHYVPEELRSDKLYKMAINSNPYIIQHMPDKYKTRENYELAFKNRWFIVDQIPEEYKDYDLYLKALENNAHAILRIPEEMRTEQMYKQAVSIIGLFLNIVPKEYMSYEICEIAVQQNGMALQFVPEEYRDIELCKKAVISNPESINTIWLQDSSFRDEIAQYAKDHVKPEVLPENIYREQINELCELYKKHMRYTKIRNMEDEPIFKVLH